MRFLIIYALAFALLGWLSPCRAEPGVRVLALFPGKALVEVDGRRKVLSEGQRFAGVQLLEATPEGARVRVGGRVLELGLRRAVSDRYRAPERREIRLLRDGNAFRVDGLINGQPVRMLVDTGASSVALSERHARALGIPYVLEGTEAKVRTASGVSRGYRVRLRSLKVGERLFRDVDAVVVEGEHPGDVLLGMNVLRDFEIEHRGNLMILGFRP